MAKGGSNDWSGSVFKSRPIKDNTYTHITYDEKTDETRVVDKNEREYIGNEEYTKEGLNEYFKTGDKTHSHYYDCDKKHDFVLSYLSELNFIELQEIEALSTNEYIRKSARYFMANILDRSEEEFEKKTEKENIKIFVKKNKHNTI